MQMKKLFLMAAALTAACALYAGDAAVSGAAVKSEVKQEAPKEVKDLFVAGITDKNPMLYKTGEEMTFTLTVVDDKNNPVKGRKIKWKRTGDDGKYAEGEAVSDEPIVVKSSTDKPGFVRIVASLLDEKGKTVKNSKNKNVAFEGSAAADVNMIKGSAEPEDFDAFWKAQKDALLAEKYTPEFVEIKAKSKNMKVMEFSLPTFPGEQPATGVLAMPLNAKPGSLPVTVKFFGYGFSDTPILEDEAKWGRKAVFSVTRHGEKPRESREYYFNLQKGRCSGFGFKRNETRESSDFRAMILRNQRVLQYAMSMPEWNGKDLSVEGGSMGAFQSVSAAGLEPKVTFCRASIPWMCDLEGGKANKRMTGWRPDWTPALGYYDTTYFAKRVKCEVRMDIGLGDHVCPPSGGVILFNNFGGKKNLTVTQNKGHTFIAYEPKPAIYKFSQEIK